MGTIARHNTQNGQKCCDNHSSFKSMVHKGNNFPCSMIITEIACRRCRRIRVPPPRASTEGPGCQAAEAGGRAPKALG